MGRPRENTVVVCGLIFISLFVIFRASPRGQVYDSKYTLLVSHQILDRGVLDLDDFQSELAPRASDPAAPLPYRLTRTGGHLHYYFPAGTPMLAAPFLGAASLLGWRVVDEDGRYAGGTERKLQRTLAAALMAGLACVLFLTARLLLPFGASLWVAIGGALGSSIWSVASRSLWSHTFLVALIGAAIWLLVRAHVRRAPLHPMLLGSLLAWAVWVRPTAALSAAGVTLLVAHFRRGDLARLIGAGALWAAVFAAISWLSYDAILPPYFRVSRIDPSALPVGLPGHLISPSRGLLVYSPVLLAVAWLLASRWRTLPHRALAVTALGIIGAHWLLVSAFPYWWGGYCYGPRLMTDVVPWLVLLAMLGLAATRATDAPASGPLGLSPGLRAACIALLALSVLAHGVGAISRAAADWNHGQDEPGFEARLWDWSDAQGLAWRRR